MHLLERLKKVIRAAPRWATRLTAENILLFVGITATAWLAPYMHDGRITTAQAHHVQQVLVVTAAAMVFTFAVRTMHDIRRHRQAKNVRQAATERAGRTLIRALELLTVAVWILMPLKLVRTVNALREERRAAQRAHLP